MFIYLHGFYTMGLKTSCMFKSPLWSKVRSPSKSSFKVRRFSSSSSSVVLKNLSYSDFFEVIPGFGKCFATGECT